MKECVLIWERDVQYGLLGSLEEDVNLRMPNMEIDRQGYSSLGASESASTIISLCFSRTLVEVLQRGLVTSATTHGRKMSLQNGIVMFSECRSLLQVAVFSLRP